MNEKMLRMVLKAIDYTASGGLGEDGDAERSLRDIREMIAEVNRLEEVAVVNRVEGKR